MDDDQARQRYEQMWVRRKRVMDEMARKERRREQESLFSALMDKKGGNHEAETE